MPLALVISPDSNTSRLIGDELRLLGMAEVRRTIEGYPCGAEMEKILNVYTPDVVFVHCMRLSEAMDSISAVANAGTGTPVIALNCPADPPVMMGIIRSGARELLTLPVVADEFGLARENIRRVLEAQRPYYAATADVRCFLPARAGVGTSVIAVNTAVAAGGSGKRVLLCDLDPVAGMVSFLMKTPPGSSLRGALECSSRMDEDLWSKFVYRCRGIDVIGGGGAGTADIRSDEVTMLFRFLARLYDVIVVDLSGALEPFSLDLMKSARHIYLVTTPEVPALHFGRLKAQILCGMDLHDRLSVIVNRACRDALSAREIEKLLEVPVRSTLPNDYKRVNAAAMADGIVDAESTLGRQIHAFAASITGVQEPAGTRSDRQRGFRKFFMPAPRPVESLNG